MEGSEDIDAFEESTPHLVIILPSQHDQGMRPIIRTRRGTNQRSIIALMHVKGLVRHRWLFSVPGKRCCWLEGNAKLMKAARTEIVMERGVGWKDGASFRSHLSLSLVGFQRTGYLPNRPMRRLAPLWVCHLDSMHGSSQF